MRGSAEAVSLPPHDPPTEPGGATRVGPRRRARARAADTRRAGAPTMARLEQLRPDHGFAALRSHGGGPAGRPARALPRPPRIPPAGGARVARAPGARVAGARHLPAGL